ncbi:MAG: UPF0182 family protein [Chloroflexi bacterium]|jgi:hypothetical protein|nr:UPF0182 family protein [Chloroflexota bacterium]
MRDLFDDFLRELNERQAQATGGRNAGRGNPRDGGDDTPDADGVGAGADAPGAAEVTADAGADAADTQATDTEATPADEPAATEPAATESDESESDGPVEEPIVISSARRGAGGRGGRGGGRPPRRPVGGPNDGGSLRQRVGPLGPQVLLVVVGLVLFAALFLVGAGLDLVTDAIWYESVGFDPVFWTRLGAQVALFVGALVVALIFLLGNLWLAGRLAPPPSDAAGERMRGLVGRLGEAARSTTEGQFGRNDPFGGSRRGDARRPDDGPPRPTIAFEAEEIPDLSPLAIAGLVLVAILAALGTAGAIAASWDTVLLWQNRVPFAAAGAVAVVDPVFGRDVSYYLFELPFLRLVQAALGGLLIAALVVTGGRYLLAVARGGGFPTPVRVHLGVLGGLYLLTVAAGYQLGKLELVYSTSSGIFTGVGYTDQAARFFAFDALTIVAGVVAALLVGGAFTRWVWPLGAAVAVWFGLSILLGNVYPEIIQRFTVEPNQFAQEQPYIVNNLETTRSSFAVDRWEDRSYAGDAPLTAKDLIDEAPTFKNARLWDYRPLQTTLDQIQTLRQYYDFVDVDVDRYEVDGETRQVMLSARELAPERNPQGGSWVNQRIVFTHGFGMAMVPVNEVDDQGLPRLWVRDMPPRSTAGAPTVSQPRIYFGERPSDWVVVGAQQAEFDYPLGEGDGTDGSGNQVETRWTGTTGIKLDSILSRLLFAARFRDLNLLISDQVTSSSQLLMHRSLGDRLGRIAPFLAYDKDPYIVVDGSGEMVWIQDAYTLTNRYPNAQEFSGSSLGEGSGLAGTTFNYLRNSVKIVMDVYDGSMTFYVADPSDPLIRAWQGVFPTLFRPLTELPDDLRAHLRVPEELFNVQTRVFASYHVTDPLTFFQGDDLWTVPQNPTVQSGQLPLEAYYVYMRMPGEAEPEFLLLQPMVPKERPNMISWVAARNDGDEYGNVRVYRFPRDTSIFGPVQIEARIDQDPQISSQITLWSQAGSEVVRGNLIVVPVQDSIIYLEPIYLQSTGSAIPEFTKIVVASPTKVVWGDTLEEALRLLLAGGPEPTPEPTPTPGPSPSPGSSPTPSATPGPGGTPQPDDVQALIRYANERFEAAQRALAEGDFATYGAEMDEVEKTLRQLEILAGSPSPAP